MRKAVKQGNGYLTEVACVANLGSGMMIKQVWQFLGQVFLAG